ncbi:MAG: hypothetical protein B6243_03400 [Anaerolineaceae bacterium 4572_5.2]|nr:MAG: hypothetical protein B6243_03400 [Anaerolineaceae bacterium 4572_5.2]
MNDYFVFYLCKDDKIWLSDVFWGGFAFNSHPNLPLVPSGMLREGKGQILLAKHIRKDAPQGGEMSEGQKGAAPTIAQSNPKVIGHTPPPKISLPPPSSAAFFS